MRIFVCYASDDQVVADEIVAALRNDDHEVFHGETTLEPSGDYHERIRREIEGADLFVFLISPASVARGRYTLTELKIARRCWPKAAGRVLPVVVGDVPMSEVPAYLRSVTLLEPEGSVAAEVVAEVESLAAARAATPDWDGGSRPGESRKGLSLLLSNRGCQLSLALAFCLVMVGSVFLFRPQADTEEGTVGMASRSPEELVIRSLRVHDMGGRTEIELALRVEGVSLDHAVFVQVGTRELPRQLERRLDSRTPRRALVVVASTRPDAAEVAEMCARLVVRDAGGDEVARSELTCETVEVTP